MAVIIPEIIPSTAPNGVKRLFSLLSRLPDDYLIYCESFIHEGGPDFILISQHLGLLVIQIRNWYPRHILKATKDVIRIAHPKPRNEIHPILHAREFLESCTRRAKSHPLCSSLLLPGENASELTFPTGTILLLPNCTAHQLTHHQQGDLLDIFGHSETICQDQLTEMEDWSLVDQLLFLRSCVHSREHHVPLTCDQVHVIRAIIHPDIIVEALDTSTHNQLPSAASLKTLDCVQEKKLYLIPSGHYILYGPVGSGKTAILVSRARILHNLDEKKQILILTSTSDTNTALQKSLTRFPRIVCHAFEEWAELQGVTRRVEDTRESDQDFGMRLYRLLLNKSASGIYDAIFIDGGNEFSSSWFQCAREALKDPDKGDLVIIVDGQKPFQGPGGERWKDLGIHIRGHIRHHGLSLGTHLQNTREILSLLRLFLLPDGQDEGKDEENRLACACQNRSGLKPLLIWHTSQDSQIEYATFLVQRLLSSLKSAQHLPGLKPNDIAILYPYAESSEKNLIRDMVDRLGRYFPVQWVSQDSSTYDRVTNQGVKVHDCHSIGGLHYRVVIILFAENFDRFFKDSEFFSDRDLFYLSLISALDYLIIQYTDRTAIIRKILASGLVDEFTGK